MNSDIGDVWSFTSAEEDDGSWILSQDIELARETNDEDLILIIRSYWDNESWESICKKMDTEGSTWYVWWMDGVRAFLMRKMFN